MTLELVMEAKLLDMRQYKNIETGRLALGGAGGQKDGVKPRPPK